MMWLEDNCVSAASLSTQSFLNYLEGLIASPCWLVCEIISRRMLIKMEIPSLMSQCVAIWFMNLIALQLMTEGLMK